MRTMRKMDASKVQDPADQTHFVLSDEQWRALTEALDRPARHLPKLEKLLREPSILERG
jgi:uncharacterized protein (DUF1778 family)